VLREIMRRPSLCFPSRVFSGSRRTRTRLHSIRHRCCKSISVWTNSLLSIEDECASRVI